MALTPGNVVIGACRVYIPVGVELGLTSEAGVTFGEATRDYYDVFSDQALMPVKKSLIRISRTISFELQEISMANMEYAFGAEFVGGVLTYAEAPAELGVKITGPAINAGTFTYTTTCWSISCGDVVRHKATEALLPVTLEEKGNILDHNSSFGRYVES